MKILAAILFLISFVTMISCERKTPDGAATIELQTVGSLDALDTIVEVEVPEPEPAINEDSVALSQIDERQKAIDYMRNSPDWDKYSEGILPKMASDNLDYTLRLLKNRYDYFIVVDKPSMHVVLYDRFGREKKAYRMACARNYGTKHKKNDCRTPEGFFKAGMVYDSTDWLYTDENGYTSPTKGVYGQRFIRIANPVSNTIGIHGTNAPGSLGRRTSHGCVRIHPDKILELAEYIQVGMPIIVNPSVRDRRVNEEEGVDIPFINIGKIKESSLEDEKKRAEEKARADSLKALEEAEKLAEIKEEAPETPVVESPDQPSAVDSPDLSEPDAPQSEPSFFDCAPGYYGANT